MSNITISQHFNNQSVSKFLNDQLGSKKGTFVSNVIALADSDKKLQECDPSDLMKCALNATALDLPLNKNLGFAYVIPYNNRRANKVEPQFQIGYKGLIQLAIRSAAYQTINSTEVREGEIKRNKFTGEIDFLGENEEGEIVGYLAYIKMLNGFEQSFYMSVEQAKAHANKYSQAFKSDAYENLLAGKIPQSERWKYSSPWYDDFDGMAKKTVLKLLLGKYGMLSTEIQKAIEVDQQVNGSYKDNPKSAHREAEDAQIIPQDEPTEDIKQESQQPVNLKDL